MKYKVGDRVRVKTGCHKGRGFIVNGFRQEEVRVAGKPGGAVLHFNEYDLEPVGLKLKDVLTEENKGKTFKRLKDSAEVTVGKNGDLKWKPFPMFINIDDDEWEETGEPVDFMTAFKAWEDGYSIHCMFNGNKLKFQGEASFGGTLISRGEWYIGD